jgi:ABC-type Mn2+/Zn2+ transport system ATPase subunit
VSERTLLELRGATLGHGGVPVLRGVDLAVRAGSFWGVLGANGSGKTTILRTLLGLLPPLGGRVVARGLRGEEPRFGYVPQKERLDAAFPLSALDVAAMGTWRSAQPLRGLRGDDRLPLVRRCLAECGAEGFAAEPFASLSGGQKQRVLIARALAAEPEVLMLDEPLAGLDLPTTRAVLRLLEDLKGRRSLTVLMVSHRLRAEKSLFTDVAFVDEGGVTSGPAAQMTARGRLAEVLRGDL